MTDYNPVNVSQLPVASGVQDSDVVVVGQGDQLEQMSVADLRAKMFEGSNDVAAYADQARAAYTAVATIGDEVQANADSSAGDAVSAMQSKVTAAAAADIATAASAQAFAALGIQNILGTPPTALPFEVTAISGGIGTGVGGTPGEYALIPTGGPSGHQAFGTIDSTGKVASYRNANPGISTSNAAPTYVWPASAGFTTAPTAPTATVGTIPANRMFSAPSIDGKSLQAWGNNAGSLASAPFGSTQLSVALTAFLRISFNSCRPTQPATWSGSTSVDASARA